MPHLKLIVNNAAALFPEQVTWTPDNFELQFGVDHLAHFLLNALLLPRLRQAVSESQGGKARVVAISSAAHNNSKIRWDDPNYKQRPEEYSKHI